MRATVLRSLFVAAALLAAGAAVARAQAPAAVDTIAAATGEGGAIDYLWVLRTALLDRASIDSVVARAREMGVRGLLVQVVGRGDAFYRSDLLPRSEALSNRPQDAGFDPLGELVAGAHAAGLEVHAWVNCLLVWSGPKLPRDPRHVIRAHPEWIAALRDGRSMARLGLRERERLRVEGIYLTAAHPGVRTWIARVAREIAERYPVDGIHLDYIRQPDLAVGYDRDTRARFALESGVDPARFDRLPRAERAQVETAWASFQRRQVTAVVREVRDSLTALGPGRVLSAAVIADLGRAEGATAQPWRAWVRDRLVDRVFLMCYAPSAQTVMDQLVGLAEELGASDRIVPGIAVYNSPPSIAALKIRGARSLGYPTTALYSYDSLFSQPRTWALLRDQLRPTSEATTH